MSKETFAMIAVNAVVVPGKSGPEEVAPGNPFTVDSEEERDRLVRLGAATAGPVSVAKKAEPKTEPAKKAAAAAKPSAADADAEAAAAAAAAKTGATGSSEDLV